MRGEKTLLFVPLDDGLTLRQLDHIKDTAVAEYHAQVTWWNAIFGAGIALFGVVAVSALQRVALGDPWLPAVFFVLAGVLVAGSSRGLALEKKRFEAEMRGVVQEIERMKPRRSR